MNFSKIWRQMRNLSDNDTAMENLKNNIDQLMKDASLLRMSQYFVFKDSRKLKKLLVGSKSNKTNEAAHWREQV